MKRPHPHGNDSQSDRKRRRLQEAKYGKTGRNWTLSIAFPASIVQNAQTEQLKAALIGRIARTASVFNVDEIVVFEEVEQTDEEQANTKKRKNASELDSIEAIVKLLTYAETPQYLRRKLFSHDPLLQFSGYLPPLDMPHHMRENIVVPYREGVVLTEVGKRSTVNIGLRQPCVINKCLRENVRVTIKMGITDDGKEYQMDKNKFRGKATDASEPRESMGIYWGFQVRRASSLREALGASSFKERYDCIIGTSDRGSSVDDMEDLPKFQHILIVFGGLKGLESCLAGDKQLSEANRTVVDIVDYYLNTCPCQGSRTIRTEEAIPITLAALRPFIQGNIGKE